MYIYIFIYTLLCLHVSDSRSFGQRLHGAVTTCLHPKKGHHSQRDVVSNYTYIVIGNLITDDMVDVKKDQ